MINPKKRAIVATQNTGKNGKSATMSLMMEHGQQREVQIQGFDLDPDYKTFSILYPNDVVPVKMSLDQGVGSLLNLSRRLKDQVYLFDPRAHMRDDMLETIKTAFLADKEMRVTCLIFPADIKEVMKEIQNTVSVLNDEVDWIVVLNEGRNRSFRMYEGSDFQKQLNALGAATLTIPLLLNEIVNHLSACASRHKIHALPYRVAISEGEQYGVHIGHRGYLQAWLGKIFEQLDDMAHLLYLPADAARIACERAEKRKMEDPPTAPGEINGDID